MFLRKDFRMSAIAASILAQSSSDDTATWIILIVELAIVIVMAIGMWKVFEKAGHPGWAAIVPIYNVIVLLQIAEKPLWWLVLYVIPVVNLIPAILVPVEIAKNFGKSGLFAVGLIFLPFIFYPLLGFGDAQYQPQGVPQQRGFAVGPPR